jgi:hypothetical protein
MCSGWTNARLQQFDQDGVVEAIGQISIQSANGFRVFISQARYSDSKIRFNHYHAAHFLLVIGSDGKNYLGAEVKYNLKYMIADLKIDWNGQFLQKSGRLEKIRQVNDENYIAIGSRHRGVLYNDFIEKAIRGSGSDTQGNLQQNPVEFWFPHIL